VQDIQQLSYYVSMLASMVYIQATISMIIFKNEFPFDIQTTSKLGLSKTHSTPTLTLHQNMSSSHSAQYR
jgi:hypothetical protein